MILTGTEISSVTGNRWRQISPVKTIPSTGTLLKKNITYDAIILDPPRSGLDQKTKKTLLSIQSPKLIYISCNPMTLARDINILKESYTLKEISLIDMFPNSYHVESICLLERK